MERTVFLPEDELSFGVSRGLNVFVLLLLFGVFALMAPAAHAASLIVNSLSDGISVDSNCTLREAIQNANNNAATNVDCLAGSGADTITFTVSGTITLGSTLPNITAAGGALTIDGTGQTVTISGNNTVRVALIDNVAALTLNNLTIANGNSAVMGGGISSSGTLTITNCTFSGNSTTSGGGGIYNNSGTLTITNSTFSGNSTGDNGGGAIENEVNGTLTITNCTFSGNSTTGDGGAIENFSMFVTVINSTFSGNSADSEGDGIFTDVASAVTLRNTIFANNASGENCSGAGTITNGGNNIEDGTTCGWNSTNGSMSGTNPMLGPLANNGGPTQTMALLTGSPAINGVTFNSPNSALTTDQRGVMRPQGALYDIGAYEYQAAPASVPTMNEWGMIIFIVLAGLGAIYYLRRYRRAES